jgi:hypothetical protein
LLASNFLNMLYCYIGITVKLRFNAWKNIRELNSDKDTTLRQANRIIIKVPFLLFIYILFSGFEFFNFLIEIITGESRLGINDYISTNLVLLGLLLIVLFWYNFMTS